MKVKSESEAAQSCPTLSDPMDCSPLGSSVHGIFQARVLEWGAIAFSNTNTHTHTHTHKIESMAVIKQMLPKFGETIDTYIYTSLCIV